MAFKASKQVVDAWKKKAATHAAIQRSKDLLTNAALAGAPEEVIRRLDQQFEAAIVADQKALELVAEAAGFPNELFAQK